MFSATNRHQAPLNLADLEPLRDIAPSAHAGECPFMARLSRGAGDLRRWLLGSAEGRRARLDTEPLDDHTLSDIGIPRIETLYLDTK